MIRRRQLLMALPLAAGCRSSRAPQKPLAGGYPAQQCLRVLTIHARASTGWMTLMERPHPEAPWTTISPAIPVSIGRNGQSNDKREGDGCSPSGAYRIGSGFGSGPRPPGVRLPWIRLTAAHAGVDDPASRFYNRIIDSRSVTRDWHSAENMIPASGVYRLGAIVEYNHSQIPGKGSCIFLHIWSAPGTPTAGCTAMSAADLLRVLQWLDPAKSPVLDLGIGP